MVGIIWLFLLPLDEYSRQTYISENALLPGQVHTYFGGSEQNVFRGYKEELSRGSFGGSLGFTPTCVLLFIILETQGILLIFPFPFV